MARKSKTDSSKSAASTANSSAWFAEPGKDDDIVISTRARLIRNLADFPFPSKMTEDDKKLLIIERQALHAFELKMTDPFDGKEKTFDSPLPAELKDLE